MRGRLLLVLAAAAVLAGCGTAVRLAYNNSDFALRLMANEYFDLEGDQVDILKAQLARFHEWHRREEMPIYASVFRSAAERVADGIERADVVWAVAEVRARYLALATQGSEEAAPVVASLKPDNFAALEKKFARGNAKFTKEYLSGDQAKRDRVRAKRFEEQFEMFMGDLTDEQRELILRFAQSQPRMSEVRLDERKRRQQEFVQLIKQYQTSPELAERLGDYFGNWERDGSPEHAQLVREWEDRLVKLILDIDRTMTAEQRSRLVQRFEAYAEDCQVLARQGRPAGEVRAALLDFGLAH